MAEHKIKVWSEYWDALVADEKPFEVRRDDRGYQKGDVLVLEKFDRKTLRYDMDGYDFSAKPKAIRRTISYVLTGGQFGIEAGYVVLGLKPADAH